MEYLWVCRTCLVGVVRTIFDIAHNGNPYCPECATEMEITKASGSDWKEVLSKMNGIIRL